MSDPVDHSKMDHADPGHTLMESSPGAADAPFDLQFIDSMVAHHQGAIEMAKLADTHAGRPELKKYASAIVAAQDREVTQMKRWREEWHKGAKPAINMDFPGMHHGMQGMDLSRLGALKGNGFDLEFLRQMILHHEGAVTMSRTLKEKAATTAGPKPELIALANAIVIAQEAEISQMKDWLAAWSK